ncbi:hypothetical protein FJY71_01815 [candidate division WOR-3 bacterium]|nr:hypothetical protein [candidate division WOR-3 bacterium]
MKNRPVRAGGRSVGLLLLAVVVAGVTGSVLSYFLSGLFPAGPVRDFFFKSVQVGVPTATVSLGFATVTFGLAFAVSALAAILVVLAAYLWYRF